MFRETEYEELVKYSKESVIYLSKLNNQLKNHSKVKQAKKQAKISLKEQSEIKSNNQLGTYQ